MQARFGTKNDQFLCLAHIEIDQCHTEIEKYLHKQESLTFLGTECSEFRGIGSWSSPSPAEKLKCG